MTISSCKISHFAREVGCRSSLVLVRVFHEICDIGFLSPCVFCHISSYLCGLSGCFHRFGPRSSDDVSSCQTDRFCPHGLPSHFAAAMDDGGDTPVGHHPRPHLDVLGMRPGESKVARQPELSLLHFVRAESRTHTTATPTAASQRSEELAVGTGRDFDKEQDDKDFGRRDKADLLSTATHPQSLASIIGFDLMEGSMKPQRDTTTSLASSSARRSNLEGQKGRRSSPNFRR